MTLNKQCFRLKSIIYKYPLTSAVAKFGLNTADQMPNQKQNVNNIINC